MTPELFKDLPPEYVFLAQDKDGTIKAYTHKPFKDDIDWYPNYMIPGSRDMIVRYSVPNTVVTYWEDSLLIRTRYGNYDIRGDI